MRPNNYLLASLPPDAFLLLRPHLRTVELQHDIALHQRQPPVEDIIFPETCLISLVAAARDGSSVEVAALGREAAVGMTFGGASGHAFTRPVVRIGGNALVLSSQAFDVAATRNAAVRDITLQAAQVLLVHVQRNVVCYARHSANRRLARWLLHAHDRTRRSELPVTQETLSEMLAVQRTTVTSSTRDLENEGLIHCRRGAITVIDRPRLEAHACECHGGLNEDLAGFYQRDAAPALRDF